MNTSRRTLLSMVPVLLLALLWPSPAQAADEIGFSNDGVTWSTSLPAPLFDPATRWVPGDERSASFYVRNQGPSNAFMVIEARGVDTDDLLENDDIHLQARVVGQAWVPLRNGVASAPLSEDRIGVGESVQVEVSAVFDAASVNRSQTKNLPLSFTVTLAEADPGTGPGGPGTTPAPGTPDAPVPGADGSGGSAADRDGVLPSAGTVIGLELLLAAIVLCAVGAFLIARRSSSADDSQNGVTP